MLKRKHKFHISTYFVAGIVTVSFLATILLATFWTVSEYYHFKSVSKEMKNQFIESQKTLLKTEVERVIDYIEYEKSKTEERLKENIKSRIHEAFTIIESLYNQYNGKIPVNDIKIKIIETLRDVRFNKGRGYYFAANLSGVLRLLPDRPELENTNLINTQDTEGQYVIRDIISLVRDKGEGYYRYHWTKPGTTGKGYPKIAFIKHFKPFDWYIGTGCEQGFNSVSFPRL